MTTFVSEARITWTVLDPRSGTKHIIDPQYERERRTAKATPSPRFPYPEALATAEAELRRVTRTLTSVGFDRPLAAEIAREFVDLEDRS